MSRNLLRIEKISKKLNKQIWTNLQSQLKYVLTDCDGVLWNGKVVVPSAPKALTSLRNLGLKIGFVTNNSDRTSQDVLNKCHDLHIEAHSREVFCVNNVAASFLKKNGIRNKVYAIGNEPLKHELEAQGFQCYGVGPDKTDGNYHSWLNMKIEAGIEAVVVGMDSHFSLTKVCRAVNHLKNPDCLFVATDLDKILPSMTDITLPGTAAAVAAIALPSGRSPIEMGKPSTVMANRIREEYPQMTSENTLFIGDYLDSDVAFGRRQGFYTLLVETGIHSRTDVTSTENAPTFYTPSISDLLDFIQTL